jgi:hypothetical protein
MTTTDAMEAMLQGQTLDQRLQTDEGLRGRKAIEEEGTIPAACPPERLRGTTRTTSDNRTIGEKERTLAALLRGVQVIIIEVPPDNQRMRESRKLRRRTSRSCFRETTRRGIDKRVIRVESRTLAVLLRGHRVTAIEGTRDNRRMRESRKLRRTTSRLYFLEMTRSGIDKRAIREEERTRAVLLQGHRVIAIEEPLDNRRLREERKLHRRMSR